MHGASHILYLKDLNKISYRDTDNKYTRDVDLPSSYRPV